LGLEPRKMLVDWVPGARPVVHRPAPDSLTADASLIAIGNSRRDWRTLAKALDTLSEPITLIAGGRNRLSDNQNVRWTGTQPEGRVLEHLTGSGVHVLSLKPSDHACGQATLVRAMMEGVPTVATDLKVLADYFPEHGVVRVPAGDPMAIVDAVQRWRSSSELWHRARDNAFEFATRFEHAPFARRMAQIANEIVASPQ